LRDRARVPAGDAVAPVGSSFIDWADLSGLDKIVAIFSVGDNVVIVETSDGREIRITAWRDLKGGRYNADFERRGTLKAEGREYHVWAHTTAYGNVDGDNLQGCLEEAVLQVDRVHVY
jgi:hypothetical protein